MVTKGRAERVREDERVVIHKGVVIVVHVLLVVVRQQATSEDVSSPLTSVGSLVWTVMKVVKWLSPDLCTGCH